MLPIWTPTPEHIRDARLTAFAAWLARERDLHFDDYEALWQWSVTDLAGFWTAVWQFFGVRASVPPTDVLADAKMPGARWFPGCRLNLYDQVFAQARDDRPAVVHANEAGDWTELGWAPLRAQVDAVAAALAALGVQPGDRVVAWLPNVPQTLVAFLACARLGAIWSVCSPDMGLAAVVDRFRQIAPKVLVGCDGYRYGGKAHDRADLLAQIRAALPSLQHTVLVPILVPQPDPARFPGCLAWSELADRPPADPATPAAALPFDHPLWIVYSSGTTGVPKAIVHGHGGVILELLKCNGLHNDLGPDDRFHWYASTGWIMWNIQIGGLLVGSTLCLFDGSPGWPDFGALWRFVARAGVTFCGAGAAYYASCMKAAVVPRTLADLSRLRALGSTGSPLAPEAYRWIYQDVKPGVWLDVISGGTDFCGAFVAGNIALPLYEGEMQCRSLGAAVESWDEQGRAHLDVVGELVCCAPLPSMPLYLWGDTGGVRYHDSYFDMYPGIWRHGDWIRLVPRPGAVGAVIYGRSDATINRHGIRMGTAELYRAVEALPEVLDALVVDLEYLGRPSYMPLFVVLRPGVALDEPLQQRLRAGIRTALTPRHVPDDIFAVPDVPRTLSGKKMELPVRKLLLGKPVEQVAHPDAMANPASLAWYVTFANARASIRSD